MNDWADKTAESLLPYSFTNGTARVEDIRKARADVANALRATERLTMEEAAKICIDRRDKHTRLGQFKMAHGAELCADELNRDARSRQNENNGIIQQARLVYLGRGKLRDDPDLEEDR